MENSSMSKEVYLKSNLGRVLGFFNFNLRKRKMSQILCRIAKLSSSSSSSLAKQGLCFSELRFLSTATTTPYLLFMENNWRRGETVVVDMNLYDPRKQERVKIPDQTLSEELDDSLWIGSSKGWVGMKKRDDSSVRLTNIYNPSASVSSHKVISLPPLLDDSEAPVSSISLSASPNQQGCVVAAKSCGPFISLCRPGDSDWTRVKVPFFASEVMYSVRDRRFYLYRKRTEVYNGPIDLIDTSCYSDFPQVSLYQSLPLSDIPKSRHDQIISTYNTQYLVQSPSGDSFIVCWCKDILENEDITHGDRPPYKHTYKRETIAFVVFRQDPEQRIATYTEDIGDLCIFLGQNEAFCVSAIQYPGLTPNSVYFSSTDMGFGFYDLSSGTLHGEVSSSCCIWLAPLQ